MQSFFARWAPPSERSFLPAIAYAGGTGGKLLLTLGEIDKLFQAALSAHQSPFFYPGCLSTLASWEAGRPSSMSSVPI